MAVLPRKVAGGPPAVRDGYENAHRPYARSFPRERPECSLVPAPRAPPPGPRPCHARRQRSASVLGEMANCFPRLFVPPAALSPSVPGIAIAVHRANRPDSLRPDVDYHAPDDRTAFPQSRPPPVPHHRAAGPLRPSNRTRALADGRDSTDA